MARVVLAAAAAIGSGLVVVTASPPGAGATGILPPSNPGVSLPPQVTPQCSLSPVDDTSAGCIDSVLHDINYARSVEGLGPLVLPSDFATDSVAVQQLIVTDEERGDRGLSEYAGLDATLNAAAQSGAVAKGDPSLPAGFVGPGGSIFAQDYTPLGADYAWMYNDGYGGTNLDCTTPGASGCWGHRDNILGPWTSTGTQTAMMGAGNTPSGQYAEIFASQPNPADSLVDPITPGSLPTPSTVSAPDVVRVLPASSSTAAAGTPVTIEGNYFTASPTPQVSFGGVPATNVHVNWNGELTVDAPADPAGNANDQVVVTVTTAGGTSSSTGAAAVNEYTYAPPPPPSPSPSSSPTHGYWLVGSDGGIFTFGSAQFHGSTGSLHLQRPVVGITPTSSRGGYWLVASDGGIFAFGNAGYYGSIPGSGLHPAGSGLAKSLNAPIVGMVPSTDGRGYFMVSSDGGVFAFGDARFEGSCPGIGGCNGAAVAVVPDASGNGYWVMTSTGRVYTFGDAANYGAPGPQGSAVTSAVSTANGGGYWILDGAGQVFPFGNAAGMGSLPPGAAGALDPASAIFATSDGAGYWVVTALGRVWPYGDAPTDGDMSATHLNGPIVAASGS
jgi:hypothetical protein